MAPESPSDPRPGDDLSAHQAAGLKPPVTSLTDSEAQIDMPGLRAYRLGRVRGQLRARDYAGLLLFDPINIRYATGARNMTVWLLHNQARYCFIPTEGPVVLFEFHNCAHLAQGLETIDEIRPTCSWFYFGAGPKLAARAEGWAREVADLVGQYGGGNRRLALDHCNPSGAFALAGLGIELCEGQEVMEQARAIKSPGEIGCMRRAIAVCEAGMARMRHNLEAGMTENQLWSILHQSNIALGGEWIETRLLSSGERTNPWFQECSDRIIRPGELVCYDTDLIGPFGYCADISRAHFCGPGRPSETQRRLYGLACEQIEYNLGLLKPGMTFRELAEAAFVLPPSYADNRYSVVFHGVGLCDEYPHVAYAQDLEGLRGGYDGVVQAGMTLCVESYIGEVGGAEGVKLEDQVLVTETGIERLSTFPYEEDLLPREV